MRIQLLNRGSSQRILTWDRIQIDGLELPVFSVNISIEAGNIAIAEIRCYVEQNQIPSIAQILNNLVLQNYTIENNRDRPSFVVIRAPLGDNEIELHETAEHVTCQPVVDNQLIRFFKTKGKKNAS